MSDDLIKRLSEAVARAWCLEKNAAKEMDTDLAEGVLKEIIPLIEELQRENTRLDAGWSDANFRALDAGLKLAKAVNRLANMRDDQIGYRHVVHFRRGASVTLAELEKTNDSE